MFLGGTTFEFGEIDIEVKSTRTARREHFIHGLKQLEPSMGHELFLLSLRFEAAGYSNGKSLYDRIVAIRRKLSDSAAGLEEFETRLKASGFVGSN